MKTADETYPMDLKVKYNEQDWHGIIDTLILPITKKSKRCETAQQLLTKLIVEKQNYQTYYIESLLCLLYTERHNRSTTEETTITITTTDFTTEELAFITVLNFLLSDSDCETTELKYTLIEFIFVILDDTNDDNDDSDKPKLVLTAITDRQYDAPILQSLTFWKKLVQVDQKLHSNPNVQSPPNNSNNNRESMVIQTGQLLADSIYGGAKLIQTGLSSFVVPNVTSGIDSVGDYAKQNLESYNDQTDKDDEQDESIQQVLDQTAKVTNVIRRGTAATVHGIRNVSTKGVQLVTKEIEKRPKPQQEEPPSNLRNVATAAGTIGVATLGAAAILHESIFDATKAVLQKSVSVTSNVVEHKYGERKGSMVQVAGDSAGNVLRTISHVATMETKILAQVVAKNSAKVSLEERYSTTTDANTTKEENTNDAKTNSTRDEEETNESNKEESCNKEKRKEDDKNDATEETNEKGEAHVLI